MPRRSHLPWLALRECKPHAGADRCIWLVGKQSGQSNNNVSGLTSACLRLVRSASGLPDHTNRPCSLLLERACLAHLNRPTYTKSILQTLHERAAYATVGPLRPNLLSLHELPSVASLMPLTKVVSTRYAGVQAGGLRCGESAATISGSVPGTLDNQGKEARS